MTAPEPGWLHFNTSLQAVYAMDGFRPYPIALMVLTDAYTPHTWVIPHDWEAYKPGPGTHFVLGEVVGYGQSAPALFNVVAPTPPVGDFVIDFDTIPGTTAQVGHLMAYDFCRVRFHTIGGRKCQWSGAEGNAWLEGFDPYPVGFNVAMSFDRPVFGASARVAAAVGRTVTMVAKDANGQILGEATSPPVTELRSFSESVSLKTIQPIATLEWRPSDSNSMCAIDNVRVITSPDPAPVIRHSGSGGSFRLSWPTVPGTNYQVWSSADLRTWSASGPPRLATTTEMSTECQISACTGRFFRVQVLSSPAE